MASSNLTKCIVFSSALCALCAISSPTLADTYHWVDNNGVDNYSEQKPRNISDDRITKIASGRAREETPSPQTSNIASIPEKKQNLDEKQQELLSKLQASEASRQADIAAVRQNNCEKSQELLTNLSSRGRIRVRDGQGNERVLPEEERQQRIADAQARIVDNCDA